MVPISFLTLNTIHFDSKRHQSNTVILTKIRQKGKFLKMYLEQIETVPKKDAKV